MARRRPPTTDLVILRNVTEDKRIIPLDSRWVPVDSGGLLELTREEFEAVYWQTGEAGEDPLWEVVGTAPAQLSVADTTTDQGDPPDQPADSAVDDPNGGK